MGVDIRKPRSQSPAPVLIMSMDLYTQNISLTQKAKFWSNYISALKGQETLCAAGEGECRVWYPSVWETVPSEAKDLKKEIGKIEDQMLSRKRQGTPPDPRDPPGSRPDFRQRIYL